MHCLQLLFILLLSSYCCWSDMLVIYNQMTPERQSLFNLLDGALYQCYTIAFKQYPSKGLPARGLYIYLHCIIQYNIHVFIETHDDSFHF